MDCSEWLRQVFLADLPRDRRLSSLLFAVSLGVALATFQLITPVKTAIFINVVGTSKEPAAKSLVLAVLCPVLVIYGILVSKMPSAKTLVLAVCGIYMAIFLFIAMALLAANGNPPAWIAWFLYFAVETRGVIIMPMIWSVVTDVTSAELSKKCYPFFFFVIQIGGILGSLAAIKVSSLGGEVGLLLLQTGCFVVIAGLTWLACSVIHDDGSSDERLPITGGRAAEVLDSATQKVPSADSTQSSSNSMGKVAWEAFTCGFAGLWLLLSTPYSMMTYWVSYAYLVPRTVLDYENTVLVQNAFVDQQDQIAFFGNIYLISNIATGVIALFATRKLVQAVGMRWMLLVLPLVLLGCIVLLSIKYTLTMSTAAVIVASTMAYSLNSPCKEMLYVRTSRDIKYKAKSWAETYGNELMKLLGAQINLWINNDSESFACHPNCFHPGPTIGITVVWVALWMVVAGKVGQLYMEMDEKDTAIS